MREVNKKIEFLRIAGVSTELETGIDHAGLARAVGIANNTWSAYAGVNPTSAMPAQHQARIGELYDFDATWPEWKDGSYDDFRTKYMEKHDVDRNKPQSIINNQTGTSAKDAPVLNTGSNAHVTFSYKKNEK